MRGLDWIRVAEKKRDTSNDFVARRRPEAERTIIKTIHPEGLFDEPFVNAMNGLSKITREKHDTYRSTLFK